MFKAHLILSLHKFWNQPFLQGDPVPFSAEWESGIQKLRSGHWDVPLLLGCCWIELRNMCMNIYTYVYIHAHIHLQLYSFLYVSLSILKSMYSQKQFNFNPTPQGLFVFLSFYMYSPLPDGDKTVSLYIEYIHLFG